MKRMPALSLLTVVAAACTQLAGLTDVPPAVDDDAGTSGGASTSGSSTSGPGSSGGSASALSDGGSSGSSSGSSTGTSGPGSSGNSTGQSSGGGTGSSAGKLNATTLDATPDAYPTDAPADAGGFADGAGVDAPPDAPSPGLVLIDDMEAVGVPVGSLDGPGLAGSWFDFDDGTAGGVLVPPAGSVSSMIISVIPGGRGTAVHAAHITANSGFTSYGAGMGFSLNASPTTPHPYDASAYQGFTFWARALGDAATTIVRFNVLDKNTTLVSGGGVCDGGTCNAYYGFTLTLTNAWQSFTVSYADLERPSYALPDGLPFDPSNMMGCQFLVSQGVAFDLWVNDIYFVDK